MKKSNLNKLKLALDNIQGIYSHTEKLILDATDNLLKESKSSQQTILDILLADGLKACKDATEYRSYMKSVICSLTGGKFDTVNAYHTEKLAGHQVLRDLNTWLGKNFKNTKNPIDLTKKDSAKLLSSEYKKRSTKTGAKSGNNSQSRKAVQLVRSEIKAINDLTLKLEQYYKDDKALYKTIMTAMTKAEKSKTKKAS
ncbi:MAG: hypothetical protein Unbinned3329contig1000_8 [Prokaryotic dsDNA virus sp.]|jgi:hypothetical protein|nr:MAG: hypothetical protein Unbinned3329contig1000_8 [Prokaryotic dsDNA virus sp.]|tara:strand:- start:23 stop:616 length:594 start_codon:yes stop_codon:yes gene_type:complete